MGDYQELEKESFGNLISCLAIATIFTGISSIIYVCLDHFKISNAFFYSFVLPVPTAPFLAVTPFIVKHYSKKISYYKRMERMEARKMDEEIILGEEYPLMRYPSYPLSVVQTNPHTEMAVTDPGAAARSMERLSLTDKLPKLDSGDLAAVTQELIRSGKRTVTIRGEVMEGGLFGKKYGAGYKIDVE